MGRGKPKSSSGNGKTLGKDETLGVGSLNLPEAPVFYPTEEEFSDPLRFIEKIRCEAEPYGLCKIVPPKSWKPPFALDLHTFSFPTKLQAIHQLQERPATCDSETFELEYRRFLEKQGVRRPKSRPTFRGEELDLCKLYNAVKRHGGFEKVVQEKKWTEVMKIVFPGAGAGYSSVLAKLYERFLYEYEVFQQSTGSGKRMRKFKRGAKRAGVDSINGPTQGLKRRRRNCQDSTQSGNSNAGKENKDNKRLKRKEEDSKSEPRLDQICEQCESGLHEESMLLCDRCDRGWHLYCLSPPLAAIPIGNWYCLDCLNSEKDSFGFIPGELHSLDAFRRLAEKFKRKWFPGSAVGFPEIERRFWEIVEGSAGAVEVMYGSDLDTSQYGSGFPRPNDKVPENVDQKLWEETAGSPWNLNNFPKLDGSMLKLVHENIAGVMIPWLYMGMLFSSFCWHFEDHCFYSINYLHWGEPKCWYGVPGSAAEDFEQVMRKTFPDLFEAQPDLLFQLVTMLNPTVLKGNGVPIFATLQERGNFVITFPRSFHGGFNCGLNCAEAVNFASADWLPHGGFGVELYRFYHKPAVLSHDELLCVVAKNGCSKDAYPFLKEELIRVINNERNQRERLWRKGVVRMSRMTPRKRLEYVGTEEDPECIICRYYLHLSAIVCSCRPSTSVCLQHAERLCECNPDKQCLLYRYSMDELDDLLLMEEEHNAEREIAKDGRARTRRVSGKQSITSTTLVKKVKGRNFTHKELAETWLATARTILRSPMAEDNINDMLKEAEQFLWAGHEMDLVRTMENDLRRAQKWSEDLRECLSAVEIWMNDKHGKSSKVNFKFARHLIDINPVSCIEPGYSKLKAMVEDASILEERIKVALTSSSSVMMTELKDLLSRVMESPFELVEAATLERVVNSAKDWLVRAEECLVGKKNSLSSDTCSEKNINILYDLQAEVAKIPVILPEMELLNNLIRRVEMWQGHARELLDSPLNFQELEVTLEAAKDFNFRTSELDLLIQYKNDVSSWITHCHNVLQNIHEQTEYSKVVEDLTSILAAGRSLRIQGDELDIVELELRKFLWREKASTALCRQLPLKILEELIIEASKLKLSSEKLVIDVSATVRAAYTWEQNAKNLLCAGGLLSEFNDLVRKSDDICTTLPSLIHIKGAISAAELWLKNAKPFVSQFLKDHHKSSPLRVDTLKELLNKSKSLKVSLNEAELLQRVLKNVESWRTKAAMLQASANSLLNSQNAWNLVNDGHDSNSLTMKHEELIASLNSSIKNGMTFGVVLDEIAKLKEACAALTWNLKALSFSSKSPAVEDVESLIDDARNLPITPREYKLLESSLLESKRWLTQAYQLLPGSSSKKKCDIQDLEALVANSKKLKISFPIMAGQLEASVHSYRVWQKQVQGLFNRESSPLTWPELLQLKEAGESSIVEDANWGMLASKIDDIGNWILHCKSVTDHFSTSTLVLQDCLLKIKDSLDRALLNFQISNNIRGSEDCCLCNKKSGEDYSNTVSCEDCKDRFHITCLGLTQNEILETGYYMCPFCAAVFRGYFEETKSMVSRRNCPPIDAFVGLLNEAKGLSPWIYEFELVNSIIVCAKEWQSYLKETINSALVQKDKNFSFDSRRLVIALKTIVMVELQDQESSKIELALCTNSWRNKAKSLLESQSKPSFRHVRRVLKEGLSMHVAAKDYYLQELKRIERIASQWEMRAKQVVSDQGELELDEVFKFIAEGEKLRVDFRKELAALKVRSVLYCICRKPYDEERAMIACDRCNEWYHFDCLNLPEPDSSDEGCEQLLQQECGSTGEFICPVCRPSDMQECSSLDIKVEDDDSEFTSEEMSHERDDITPPFEFTKGKRRSRVTGKARSNLQERLKGDFSSSCQDRIGMVSSDDNNQSENLFTASGRPCRRTAGQHSKFESFVLLTHTR